MSRLFQEYNCWLGTTGSRHATFFRVRIFPIKRFKDEEARTAESAGSIDRPFWTRGIYRVEESTMYTLSTVLLRKLKGVPI